MHKIISGALIGLLAACGSSAVASNYSPQNPPPASFIFAGPVTDLTDTGETTVRFKFTLIIHSLSPTKIEVVDVESGNVLVRAEAPILTGSTLKHPSDPSIAVYEWSGFTPAELVAAGSPEWLYQTGDTRVQLEVRVQSDDQPVFSFVQPATYSGAAKAAILMSATYNRGLKSR